MKRKLTAGLTSATLPLYITDLSGSGLGNLTYASAGLLAEYRRQGQASWTTINLVAGTLGNFTSGGFVADGNLTGAYEFCPPDAALAAGARWCAIRLRGATNMSPCLVEIELDVVNYQDATRFGLTALPNANASTSGGLITSGNGTGQITLSGGAVVVGTNNDKTGYQLANATLGDGKTLITSGNGTAQLAVDGGAVELTTATNAIIAGIANATTRIPSDPATESTVLSVGNTTILSIPSVVAIRAEMDANSTKLVCLDQPISTRLAAANYTAPDNANITAIANATARIPASPASAGNVTDAANATVATLQGNITSDGNSTRSAIATDGNATRAALEASETAADTRAALILEAIGGVAAATAAAVWNVATATLTAAGTAGKLLVDALTRFVGGTSGGGGATITGTADAYLSDADARVLLADMPATIGALDMARLGALSNAALAQILRIASNQVDNAIKYQGRKYDPTQTREFPRVDGAESPVAGFQFPVSRTPESLGVVWDWDSVNNVAIVPENVYTAVLYQAASLLDTEAAERLAAIASGLKGQQIGTAREDYFSPAELAAIGAGGVLCTEAEMMLRKYRLRTGEVL